MNQKTQIIIGVIVLIGAAAFSFFGKKKSKSTATEAGNQAVEDGKSPDEIEKAKIMREMASKGGKKSGEARRAKKQAKEDVADNDQT